MGQKTISILGMGWLGMPLGARLAKSGYAVKGSTTRQGKMATIRELGISPYLINVRPELAVSEYETFFNCDILIITLPPSSMAPKGKSYRRKDHQEPDGRFAEVIQNILSSKEAGPSQVVYTSSTSVYGEQVGDVDEETAPNPVTGSARSVLQVEEVIRAEFPGQNVIVRLGGLIGGDRHPGKFLAGRTGIRNGNAPVNLVHREDCIRAIIEVIRQEAWGNTFNLVAKEHPLKKDYYPIVTSRAGLTPPQFDPLSLNSGKTVLSNKIEKVLGYSFQYPDPLAFPE